MVMDRLARLRHDVLCAHHCCRAIKLCVVTVLLPLRGQEGRREEGGGNGCISAMAWCVVCDPTQTLGYWWGCQTSYDKDSK